MARLLSTDPYKNFRFRVEMKEEDGDFETVAGVNSVGPISQSTEAVDYREGNSTKMFPTKIPGQTTYAAVSLERGLTSEDDRGKFEAWAFNVHEDATARRDIRISLFNETGVTGYQVILENCLVTEYKAMPDLNASESSVAIESVTFQHEGWTDNAWESLDVKALGS